MELSFREWVQDEALITFDDIAKGTEYGVHHLMHSGGWPEWAKQRHTAYRNGVQMAKNPKTTLADNPYDPTDSNYFSGWLAGFNFIRRKTA